jgi:O-acetyl-ADP-ribose deacetylase (regulator of RNase III)
MLTYLRTSIFDSPAQTLVNTVNTVGVMGKGISKIYKDQYPAMFKEYKQLCDNGEIEIGKLHLWRGPNKWVLNFPTKTTWKKSSSIEYIRRGLEKFVSSYEKFGIRSISFPPLGCGNGDLKWPDVQAVMEQHLKNLPIDIFIHDLQVAKGFIPEHQEKKSQAPYSSEEFLEDIKKLIYKNKGTFYTITSGEAFDVTKYDHDLMEIRRSQNKVERIPHPDKIFTDAWSQIQNGLYTKDFFTDEQSSRYRSYVFAILKDLPYIKFAEYRRIINKSNFMGHALFLHAVEDGNLFEPISAVQNEKNKNQLQLWE